MARISSIVLILSVSAAAFAQQPRLSETVNVHLVEVPVTVVDRDGNPVRGLTAANFEILDQGKRQEITAFDKVDFASSDVKATSPLNPAARRSFLLLFDNTFSSPLGRAKAQEAARAFVAKTLQRRDIAAVGMIDIDRGFHLLTSFTTDRTAVVQAIANPQTFVSSDPLQIAGIDSLESVVPSTNSLQGVSNDRGGGLDNIVDVARLNKRSTDSYNRTRVEKELTMLGGLARTLRMLPGQKQIILLSEGFDARYVQGRDARAGQEAGEEMQQAIGGDVWKVDFEARFGNSGTLTMLDRMARYFRGSDVVLHAIDIQGLRVQNDLQTGTTINSNDGLYLVSNATGGVLFKNSNDITADFDKLMKQQEVVYVLGFRAASSTPGKYHELKVRLEDVPGARAYHRAGYYEAGKETPIERTLTNAEVIVNDIPANDVRINTLVAPLPGKVNSRVPVIVEIDGRDLERDAKAKSVTAELYLYAFDDEGVVRDRVFQRLTIDTAKTAEQLAHGGLKYYATLSLPPGHYAVKSLVRLPEGERKGYSRTDVTVPSLYDVAVLPPLFPDKPGSWLMVKGATHGDDAPYPFQINGEPFVPSAVGHVRSGEARQFAIFVYNANADEMTWEATLTDPTGTHTMTPTLVRELQGDFVTKLVFQYDPRGVGPGTVTLGIVIRKKGSSDARSASVPLVVTN
jgi:VWFA-related protein